jgi:DNA-binding CsgD family transcriptional regulator
MLEALTPREREIFDLLLEGVSPKEIANRLNITIHTVAFHRTKLYNKLGVQSIQELYTKYLTNDKTDQREPAGIIPVPALGFYSCTDMEKGGKSTSMVFLFQENIDGVSVEVLGLKTNLIKTENDIHTIYANMHTQILNKQLRLANGIRFKARGDGKPWQVEFQTIESVTGEIFFSYVYIFQTVRDKVIIVDIPYTSIYLPDYWEQYKFDFNKEKIVALSIGANYLQGYGSSSLQIFDFEIY